MFASARDEKTRPQSMTVWRIFEWGDRFDWRQRSFHHVGN